MVYDNDPVAELDAHVRGERWSDVIATLDEHWGSMLSENPDAVRRAVGALPSSVLTEHPRWAVAGNYVNRIVADGPNGTTVFRGTPATPEPLTLLDILASLTSKMASLRARGHFADALAVAREARSLVDEASDGARDELRHALPELQYQWAMTWEYSGEMTQAVREYTESHDSAVLIGHLMAQSSAAGALAWLHAFAGRNLESRHWLERLPSVDGAWWEGRTSITARFARTLLLLDELHYDDARAELDRASLNGVPERWPAHKYLMALIEDDPAECIVLLTEIDALIATLPEGAATEGGWAPFVAVARSKMFARIRNRTQATGALDAIAAPPGDVQIGNLQVRLWRAAAALFDGDARRAGRAAAELVGISTAYPRVLIGALAVAAAAAHRLGDADVASSHFSLAARLAHEHGSYLPMTLVSVDDLAVLFTLDNAAVPDSMQRSLLREENGRVVDPFLALSPRELIVIRRVIGNSELTDVADDLFVSRNTVKSQVRSAYRKLGIQTRLELNRLAIKHGFIETAD